MIYIYSDSQIIDLEWLPLLELTPVTMIKSFNEYVQIPLSPADTKLAFTTHRLHCDDNDDGPAYQGFEDKIVKLSQSSDLVFSFESELHNFHWQIWEQCHRDNVYWCLPGYVNDREDINSHIICWGDWFKTTTRIYQELPHKLAELTPYATKPRYFDALLGVKKPHRDFVCNAVMSSGLQDNIIMSYGGTWDDNKFYAQDYFIWEEGTVPVGKTLGTADWADYYGHRCHLSQIIPIKVYNDSAYSIVAETDYDNTLSCFTEKSAKPMLARRLFVAFTGYKYLHNLRKLGFRTFDGIIDESYDQIIDDDVRYAQAFEQVKFLCNQEQAVIYEQARDILEHNYELMFSRDWTKWAADHISDVIRSFTR